MDERKNVTVVRRGVKREVVTQVIPEQKIVEEIEVDTLQEFLKEVELTEDDLRIAVKSYKDDKVTQPTYKMEDILKTIELGKENAQQYLEGSQKEFFITDPFIADTLSNSGKFRCVKEGVIPPRYKFTRI